MSSRVAQGYHVIIGPVVGYLIGAQTQEFGPPSPALGMVQVGDLHLIRFHAIILHGVTQIPYFDHFLYLLEYFS